MLRLGLRVGDGIASEGKRALTLPLVERQMREPSL